MSISVYFWTFPGVPGVLQTDPSCAWASRRDHGAGKVSHGCTPRVGRWLDLRVFSSAALGFACIGVSLHMMVEGCHQARQGSDDSRSRGRAHGCGPYGWWFWIPAGATEWRHPRFKTRLPCAGGSGLSHLNSALGVIQNLPSLASTCWRRCARLGAQGLFL